MSLPTIMEREFTESLKRAIETTRKPPDFSALINRSKPAVTAAEIESFLYKHPKYMLKISNKLSHPHLIKRMSLILTHQQN